MIVSFTLSILIVLTLFSVILGNTFIGGEVENVINNDLIINGSTSTLELEGSALFNVDPLIGFTATIVVIVVLATIVGIQIFGSGLAENTVRVIIMGSAYTGVWVVFSLLANPLLVSIEVFGLLIYITLTIGYVYGVIQKISD